MGGIYYAKLIIIFIYRNFYANKAMCNYVIISVDECY